MSDVETPEADMMPDQSGLGAAPATLRLEESQPGLGPGNPGVAPNATMGHQRIAGLGRPISDPVWDDAERVFAECCRLMWRLRKQTARGLSLIATLYLRERHRWADFLAERRHTRYGFEWKPDLRRTGRQLGALSEYLNRSSCSAATQTPDSGWDRYSCAELVRHAGYLSTVSRVRSYT
jgi:hypothetical protein